IQEMNKARLPQMLYRGCGGFAVIRVDLHAAFFRSGDHVREGVKVFVEWIGCLKMLVKGGLVINGVGFEERAALQVIRFPDAVIREAVGGTARVAPAP